MINAALGTGEGPEHLGWTKFFDLVVCEARKPHYFGGANKSKNGAQIVRGTDRVFCGGNIDELEEKIGCSGNDILYIGDHIYADLITSKRSSHWRTMLVISELDEELKIRSGCPVWPNRSSRPTINV